MKPVVFGNDELAALRKAVFCSLSQPEVALEIGLEILERLEQRLANALSDRICTHCGGGLSRRTNGLCDPCDRYQRKYDRLPSAETIAESGRRALEGARRPRGKPAVSTTRPGRQRSRTGP